MPTNDELKKFQDHFFKINSDIFDEVVSDTLRLINDKEMSVQSQEDIIRMNMETLILMSQVYGTKEREFVKSKLQ